MTPTPTPPEGYRLLSDEEKKLPLPMDAMVYVLGEWQNSKCRGAVLMYLTDINAPYATRTAPEQLDSAPVAGWQDIDDEARSGERILGYHDDWQEWFIVRWSPGRPFPHWTLDNGAVTSTAPSIYLPLPPQPNQP